MYLYAKGCSQGASNFTPAWVQESNEIAYKVLESNAQFVPEFAGQMGVDGMDEEIFDLQPNLYERQQAASQQSLDWLQEKLATEEDPRIIQDIEIMIKSMEDQARKNMAMFQDAMQLFNPFAAMQNMQSNAPESGATPAQQKTGADTADASDSDLDDLRNQIKSMQSQIEKLAGKD